MATFRARVARAALVTCVGLALAVAVGAGCASKTSCSDIGVNLPMSFDAQLPSAFAPETDTLELCVGVSCDTASLAPTGGEAPPGTGGLVCVDVDGRTPSFQTTCQTYWTYMQPTSHTLHVNVNTAYGGHPGSDTLVLTAVAKSGARTEMVRGTVSFTDATTAYTKDACGAPFYSGKLTTNGG